MNRNRCSIAAAAAAALALATPAAAQTRPTTKNAVTVISGTLLGADGAPMKLAHVHVYPPFRPSQVSRAVVSADGRFAIAVPGTGTYSLQFTGVDHRSATIPLLIDRPATIALDVRLQHHVYTDSLERVMVVGDWNGFAASTAKPLARQPDGRYTLEVPTTADTVAYQLIGLEAAGGSAHRIAGPQALRYVYDNGGEYRSIIAAHDGKATIVLDPAELARHPSAVSITFRDPRSRAARVFALYHSLEDLRQVIADSEMAQYRRHEPRRYEWAAPLLARQWSALAAERDPLLRQIRLITLLNAAQYGVEIGRPAAQRIVREIPPSSPLWASYLFGPPWMMTQAFELAAGDTGDVVDTAASLAGLAYLDSVAAIQPDSELQAMALYGALGVARAMKDPERLNDYAMRLLTDYPGAAMTAVVRARMAPGRVWQEGAQPPAFQFASLDDSTVTYTPATFAGKVYLLDFWATWCGPCVAQMPYLQQAYDSLGSRGLEIVSISLDRTPADVDRFRTGRWKLPWHNAYVPGGLDDEQVRRLEIAFLPRAILVGRDGRIVALDEGLRGDALLPTLRRALEARAH